MSTYAECMYAVACLAWMTTRDGSKAHAKAEKRMDYWGQKMQGTHVSFASTKDADVIEEIGA